MTPARCGSGGGLLLLQGVRLQGVVVIHVHHLLLHVSPVVVLDEGVAIVLVPLLLLDLMLNVKNKCLTEYRYKKNLMDPKIFNVSGTGSKTIGDFSS
jgi:hypothetical protein